MNMNLSPTRIQMPETQPGELDIRSIAAVLRRRLRVILYTGAVILALAGAYLAVVPETYTATTLVLADPDQQNVLENTTRASSSAGQDNAKVDSEVEILRSDAIALAVIEKENLVHDPEFGPRPGLARRALTAIGMNAPEPPDAKRDLARTLARFRKAISVRRRGLTYLISVSVSARAPARAAALANRISAVYLEQQVASKVAAAVKARDVLRSQIEEARTALQDYEARFDALVARTAPEAAAGAGLSGLQHDLDAAERRLADKRRQAAEARRQLEAENWNALVSLTDSAALRALQARREALLRDMQGLGTTGQTPELRRALSDVETELGRQSTLVLNAIENDARQAELDAGTLRRKIRDAVLAGGLSGGLSADALTGFYTLQQETSIARQQYQKLLENLRDLETRARIQIPDSRVVSPAIAPVSPSAPNRLLVVLAAVAATLGVGISLAFLKEYYIGGLTSATQLGQALRSPTTTVIPAIEDQDTDRRSPADEVIDAPLSSYAESIRKLRAAIDQGTGGRLHGYARPADGDTIARGKVVLITSTLSGEGKTSTALSLGRTYAKSGKKALLIDGDLRRPSVHRFLGLAPEGSLLDYLRDEETRALDGSFYARDPASPLALIMGAARSDVPTDQLLGSARFRGLLKQARDVYDVVIIDTPPLLPVVDARYLAPFADAVVMVVKWASTSQGDLRTALAPLADAMRPGAALLPVLSQAPTRHKPGGYENYGSAYAGAR